MLKLYEGNNIYKIVLTSGKEIDLTEDEIYEISNHTLNIDVDIKCYKDNIRDIVDAIEEHLSYISNIEVLLIKFEKFQDFINGKENKVKFDSLLNELESNIYELNSLGKFI